MGGSVSTNVAKIASGISENASESNITLMLMPIYFTSEPIQPDEKEAALEAWRILSCDESVEFKRMKKEDPKLPCDTCVEYFGQEFYRRLLKVHPTCQPMFTKSTLHQGQLLSRMIGFMVTLMENESLVQRELLKLAERHNRIGVRAVEYGLFGEVLFFALKKSLGSEVFNHKAHRGWTKLYSNLLAVILPVVVAHEARQKAELKKALSSSSRDTETIDSGRIRSGRSLTPEPEFPTCSTSNSEVSALAVSVAAEFAFEESAASPMRH